MTFVEDYLSVDVGFGQAETIDPADVVWTEISPGDTPPGPVRSMLTITRGRIGDDGASGPTHIEGVIDDAAGEFSPANVSGSHYGELRQGTPMRVRADVGAGPVPLGYAMQRDWWPAWDGPNIDDRVPIDAFGVLERVSRDDEVISPLSRLGRHGIADSGDVWRVPTEHWSLEVPSGRQVSSWPGKSGTLVASAPAGSVPGPVGASSAIDLSDGVTLSGTFINNSLWALTIGVKFKEPVTALTEFLQLPQVSNHPVLAMKFSVQDVAGSELYITGVDGTSSSVTGAASTLDDGQWHHITLVWEGVPGVGASFDVYIDGVAVTLSAITLGPSPAFDTVNGILVNSGGALAAVSQVVYWTANLVEVSAGYDAYAGYPDELAADRFERLCLQNDIPYGIAAGATARMGTQPAAPTYELISECELADEGIISERRTGDLYFLPWSAMSGAAPTLTLTYQQVTDLKPIRRDPFNIVTVVAPDGRSATVEITDGPLGSDPSTGIGPRPIKVTRNLYSDEALHQEAAYLASRGTLDTPRYLVTLDLRNVIPDLADDWLALEFGARVTITGVPVKHLGPATVDLVVVGEVVNGDAPQLTAEFYGEPFVPYNVGVYTTAGASIDPADEVRYGVYKSYVDSTFVAGTDTSLVVEDQTGGNDLWSTSGATPFDVMVAPAGVRDGSASATSGGVQLRVTAVGAATGAVQTLTVQQEPINGVRRTIPAGWQVNLHVPATYGLR